MFFNFLLSHVYEVGLRLRRRWMWTFIFYNKLVWSKYSEATDNTTKTVDAGMVYGSDGGIVYAGIIMTCETLTFYTVQQCIAI